MIENKTIASECKVFFFFLHFLKSNLISVICNSIKRMVHSQKLYFCHHTHSPLQNNTLTSASSGQDGPNSADTFWFIT